MSLDDEIGRWLGDARDAAVAAERVRTRRLVAQAEQEATLAGTLVDLAERGALVSIRTSGGRAHRGTISAVGDDFVVLRGSGPRTVLALQRVVNVRLVPSGGAAATASARDAPVRMSLTALLSTMAEDRPRVALSSDGEGDSVVGELRSVGVDVVVVLADGEPRAPVYVHISRLEAVSILATG